MSHCGQHSEEDQVLHLGLQEGLRLYTLLCKLGGSDALSRAVALVLDQEYQLNGGQKKSRMGLKFNMLGSK